jgi:AraC-like DNA-binding protein
MQRAIHHRDGIGLVARILQSRALVLAQVIVEQPVVILVIRGTKTLRSGTARWVVRSGEAIAVAGGQALDVLNEPPEDGGDYEALWLRFMPGLVGEYARQHPAKRVILDAWPLRPLQPACGQAVLRAAHALADAASVPDAVARHQLEELLVWVGEYGGGFARAPPSSTATRVRALLASAPGSSWSSQAVAARLAMSEATLRRRLAEEEVTLSALRVDVRMSLALNLLQATDQPVARIAQMAGYASASRFAIRFRERFGFAPTALRGHERPRRDLESACDGRTIPRERMA